MIVCPVCETQVDLGFECPTCGKDLAGVLGAMPPPPVAVQRIADLEVTIPERVGEVAVEAAPGVEGSRFAATGEVATAPLTDMEKTVAAPLGDIGPVLPLDDMTEDRIADDGVRTPVNAGPPTCRYCKTVQTQPGALCERCGMRLTVAPTPAAAPTAGALPRRPRELYRNTRCKACGAAAVGGERCGECGQQVPEPEV